MLRELDERVAARLARGTRGALGRIPGYVPPPAPSWEQVRGSQPPGPAPFIVLLRDVDDRYARRGVLAFLREVPQLGYLLIALLVLGGGAIVLRRANKAPATTNVVASDTRTPCPVAESTEGSSLGAPLGAKVTTYLTSARTRLARLAKACPTVRRYAVVSFKRYATVDDAARLLDPAVALRVSFRVPGNGEFVMSPTTREVRAFRTDSLKAFTDEARRLEAHANELATNREVQDIMKGRTAEDRRQAVGYRQDIQTSRQTARALRGRCACVYSVLVVGEVKALAALAHDPLVRVVDPLPVVVTADQVGFAKGLLPEEKVRITNGDQAPRT